MEWIDTINIDGVKLEVYKCSCGYHMGVDTIYLDQVGSTNVECPACGKAAFIEV